MFDLSVNQVFIKVFKISLFLIGGIFIKKTVRIIIKNLKYIPTKLKEKVSNQQLQRVKTIRRLTTNTTKIIVNFTVFVMILSELGVDIIPLLTGASILGLAVGFGAKNIVADLIGGFFIILENRFNVGDWVQIGSHFGQVSRITLRTVTLKDKEKKIYLIPNSTVKTVIKFPKK